MVKVKILSITPEGKVSLSIKRALPPPPKREGPRQDSFDWSSSRKTDGMSFEDMMSKFKQTSDEKMLDLKRSVDGKHGGFSRRGSK